VLDLSSINKNKLNFENSINNSDNVFIVNEDGIFVTSIADGNMQIHLSCISTRYTVHDLNENNYSEYNEIRSATFSTNNLCNWALKNNIKHSAIDELLQMLK